MDKPCIGIVTVAVPPLIGGMWTWIDRFARALTVDAEVCLFAITHDPRPEAYARLPYAVSTIRERLHYPPWMGETLPKALRWARLMTRVLHEAPALRSLDLVISDATPGVVGLGRSLHRRFHVPWLVLMGGDTFFETRHQRAAWLRHRLLAHRLRFADGIVVDGADLRAMLEQRGVRPARIEVVDHAIDPDVFRPDAPRALFDACLRSRGRALRAPRFVMTHGRLAAEEKGVSTLLAIVQGEPDVAAVAIGRGTEAGAFERAAIEYGVEGHALGVVETDELASALAAAAICVYPLDWAAGVPRAVLEAMACGRAVVATSVGSLADVIVDGHNGRLVPAGDREAVRSAVHELLADGELCAGLGRNARATVEERFSPRIVDTRYRDIVRRALNRQEVGERGSSRS